MRKSRPGGTGDQMLWTVTNMVFSARISAIFFFLFFVFRCKTQHKPGQLADNTDHPPYLFIHEGHTWSHEFLWDLVTVESPLLQTAGVQPCVLSKSHSVCPRRIIPFQKICWNCPHVCGLPCFFFPVKTWYSSVVLPAFFVFYSASQNFCPLEVSSNSCGRGSKSELERRHSCRG